MRWFDRLIYSYWRRLDAWQVYWECPECAGYGAGREEADGPELMCGLCYGTGHRTHYWYGKVDSKIRIFLRRII